MTCEWFFEFMPCLLAFGTLCSVRGPCVFSICTVVVYNRDLRFPPYGRPRPTRLRYPPNRPSVQTAIHHFISRRHRCVLTVLHGTPKPSHTISQNFTGRVKLFPMFSLWAFRSGATLPGLCPRVKGRSSRMWELDVQTCRRVEHGTAVCRHVTAMLQPCYSHVTSITILSLPTEGWF